MRKLESFKARKPNSLLDWYKAKSPLAVAWNYCIISLCKVTPSLSVKRFLLRLTGMKIGKNVAPGLGVQFDIFFPELIEIGDNTVIGYGATILAHEFLVKEHRTGEVRIGKNAMIGANSTLLAGITIGDNATIAAGAVVTDNVRKGKMVSGVPAKEKKSRNNLK